MTDWIGGNPETLQRVLLEVIDKQLDENDPPETRQALDRFQLAGHSEQTARKLIAAALLEEIRDMLRDHREFDRAHFAALLEHADEFSNRSTGRSSRWRR